MAKLTSMLRRRRDKQATPPRSPGAAVRRAAFELVAYLLIAGVPILGALTLRTVSGYQPGEHTGTFPATVRSCTTHGPIGGYGIGNWSECRIDVMVDGTAKVGKVSPPYLSQSDAGRQISVDRFDRPDDEDSFDDYAPAGASHRNWLYFAVAVPLLIIGVLLGLLVLAAAYETVGDVRRAFRAAKADKS